MSDAREQDLKRAWDADETLESALAYYRHLAKTCDDGCPVCGHMHAEFITGVERIFRCARCGVVRGGDARMTMHDLERRTK